MPQELAIDEHDGMSWIGVVPFRMTGVMRRPWPDLPGVSAFPELNVRLYVTDGRKPGVWFLSLDATNRLAVWCARRFFHLPYHAARIRLVASGDGIHYDARRAGAEDIAFRAEYRPCSAPAPARPGTLEHFLAERYCLYARSSCGQLYRTEVHHVPWPLQPAEATVETNGMVAPHGLDAAGPPALVHFARRVDVVVWSPELVVGGGPGVFSGTSTLPRPDPALTPSREDPTLHR